MSQIKLPANPEAEQLLLGSLLSENDLYFEVGNRLLPDHFADETNRNLYQIIAQLVTEGREATPISVAAAIGEDLGLSKYLGDLVTAAHDAADNGIRHTVPGLADEIITLAERRRLKDAIEEARAIIGASPGAISNTAARKKIEDLLHELPHASDDDSETAADIANRILEEAKHIKETGASPGFRSGLAFFDDLVGPLMPGDLIIVGGATSAGKTALVQQVALAVSEQRHTLIFSMEMTKEQWINRYITQYVDIPSEQLEAGPFTDDDLRKITCALNWLAQHSMTVNGKTGLTPQQIAAEARRVRARQGDLGLIVIDHLQFIQPPSNKEGPAAVAEITRQLKGIAKSLKVPILLISHLNRDPAKRNNHRPLLADLYGGGAIEKDADTVIFVHREHYWLSRKGPEPNEDPIAFELLLKDLENKAELILAKRRRGKGSAIKKVGFNPENTLFYELR